MRIRAHKNFVWLVVLSFLLPMAPVQADPPTPPPDAKKVAAVAKKSNDCFDLSKADVKDVDWVLICLGNGMMGVGGALFVVPLIKTLTTETIPAMIRARRIGGVEAEGQKLIDELVKSKQRLDELGEITRDRAIPLNEHISNSAFADIRKLSPQEIDQARLAGIFYARYGSAPGVHAWLQEFTDLWLGDAPEAKKEELIRRAPLEILRKMSVLEAVNLIKGHDRYERMAADNHGGENWLEKYKRLRRVHRHAEKALVIAFQEEMGKVEAFSRNVDHLADGWLAWKELRTKALRYKLEPIAYKPAGEMEVSMNGGFFNPIAELRLMRKQLHAPITDCQNLMTKLGTARVENKNKVPINFALPLAVGAGTFTGGLALSALGHWDFEQRNKVPVAEVVKENEREQNKERGAELSRGQEVGGSAKSLAELRARDPHFAAVYDTFRGVIRREPYLQQVTDRLRATLDDKQKTDVALEERYKMFREDDQKANEVLDAVIAAAAAREAKTTHPESIRDLFFADDIASKSMRSNVQVAMFEMFPKMLWLNLSTSEPPYNDKAVSEISKKSADALDKLTRPPKPNK